MLYALGVLVFAAGLLLSIALHEIGHLTPAKRFGVKVTQYMVGFGPTLWSRRRGDTEYGVKAVPLGGYIRMIGMVPPRADGRRSRWPRRMATAIEDFRQVSRAEVAPGDEPRQFYRLTPGKKMIIMCGGPCMNLLIYVVITIVLLTTLGQEHTHTHTSVDSVVQCVVPANSKDAAATTCPKDAPKAPSVGRIEPHDRILAIDGVPMRSWDQIVAAIQPAAGKRLLLTIRRHGQTITVPITPAVNRVFVDASSDKTKKAGFLGISPTQTFAFEPDSITAVPGQIGAQIREGVDAIGSYPQKLDSLLGTVFEGKPRDPNGAVGIVGIGRLGGDVAASHAIDTQEKTYALFSLLASVNLLLFFFNLLPLLPLDGGHVAGAIVEAVRRGGARVRMRHARRAGHPVPRARPQIFVDTAQMLPVMYAVGSVLLLVTLLTLWADIVHPINIG